MDDTPEAKLARMAARQHAVFTPVHARAAGFTDAQIKLRLASGLWNVVHQVAYRVAGAPSTWEGDLLAACWAGGFRAVASHRSAAALHGLAGGRRSFVEITCPRWRRAQHRGLIVHETKAFEPVELTVVDHIPVTKPELTLLHLAAVRHASIVEMALDGAERRGLVTRASIEAMLGRQGRPGRNGAGVLRALVGGRSHRRRTPESEMETRLIQVLRRNGFPEPEPQYEIRSGARFVARVDAAYPQWRVAIEYESAEHHTGRIALERDSARRNKVWAAGWFPVTATKADVDAGGAALCSAVGAARDAALASMRPL